jgi:predicted choloylglycine hydrolase
MQLQFKTVSEPTKAGGKWKKLFDAYWPGYKEWFLSNNSVSTPDLKTSQEALKQFMPKFWATYQHLCKLTNADADVARFLTGFRPPAYVSACAQAVINTNEIQLVRNYDYHPDLLEGTLLLSKWNNRKVIGSSDCLIGLIDGMNDAGLCLSLTFGGRKEVGWGFGISLILRYVLEFCNTTQEAVLVLKSIPSHMSYNVTVVDKIGEFKTVMLAPNKKTLTTTAAFATNHQGAVYWPENAKFNQTVKRYNFIKNYLNSKDIRSEELAKAFLHPPLYNTKFKEGFGTLYTAVYHPEKLSMQLLWPNASLERTFDNFKEEKLVIQYDQKSHTDNLALSKETSYRWEEAVVDSLVKSLDSRASIKKQKELREKLMPQGEIAWDAITNYWNEPIL